MLTACKSVVQMIALTFSKYQTIITCSACGSLVTKYVDHCVLWCPANAGVRHRMWLGFWHKYGVDAYLRLASYDHERLIDVFFGRYEMIADLIDIADKEAFYCYILTGGNVVRGNRTVMQMKSLRDHPDMSYGSNKQWNQLYE